MRRFASTISGSEFLPPSVVSTNWMDSYFFRFLLRGLVQPG